MPYSHSLTRSVEAFAEGYARSRTERLRPVSMAHALQTARAVLPDCDWPDSQLINLVAAKVVKRGHAIAFDVVRPPSVGVNRVGAGPDILALLPDLRRRAYALVLEQDRADAIVEEAIQLAISRVSTLDRKPDLANWLAAILNEVAAAKLSN